MALKDQQQKELAMVDDALRIGPQSDRRRFSYRPQPLALPPQSPWSLRHKAQHQPLRQLPPPAGFF